MEYAVQTYASLFSCYCILLLCLEPEQLRNVVSEFTEEGLRLSWSPLSGYADAIVVEWKEGNSADVKLHL